MAAKTTAASVEKARKGFQQRTGVTLNSRTSEPLPVLNNANRARNTEKVLEELGQREQARGSNTFSVEAAKSGSPITSGFVNAFADNPKLAAAASFLAGAKPANDIFRMRQDQAMKGTLTNEMKSAGLTQEDIDTWNRQQNEKERQQVMSDWAKAHPIMSSLNAIPENAFGSIEGNIDKAIDFVKGNPIQSRQTNADIYRQSVAENIDSKLGRGAYGVANSIGDMLFAAWLTGGLGGGGATQGAKGLAKLLKGLPAAGVMGLEKSNQVMNDASERGLTNNQIAAEGLLSGASTALTEALPFSKFGEGGHIVGSMLAEGLQEGSEDILDTFFDELVTRVGGNGDKSDLSTRYRQYIGAGYNADEARKAVTTDYIKQVIMDTLAGGAAGGAMGGLGNFMGGRNIITGKIPSLNQNTEENVQTEAKTEEDIEAEDYLRSILEEANQMDINPENIRLDEQTQQAPEVPEVAQQVQPEEQIPKVSRESNSKLSLKFDPIKSIRDRVDSYIRDFGETRNGYRDPETGEWINPLNNTEIYNDLIQDMTRYAQEYPETRTELNSILKEMNDFIRSQNADQQAQPTQQFAEQLERDNDGLDEDVANVQTMEQASTVLDNEGEKLDRATHRFNLQQFAEESGEQQIPQVDDNGVHTGIYKTSKLAQKTIPNSGVVTDEEYNRVIPEDITRTERVTHEATLNKAEQNVKNNGFNGEYDRVLNDENWDAVDVDTAMLCASKCAEEARNAEALGVDSKEAWKREVKLFKKACKMATAGGQMIEAFKKWSSMTAEGKLAQAISYVNEAVKEIKNEQDLPKDVKTAAEKYLSEDFMAEFLKKAHQYDGQDVSLAKQARLNIELAQMINQQIPVKFRQKFTSLWMDNLLASLRTLGSRNFGGNIGKAALDQTLVKMFSGPIDNFISRYTGTRTTTGFTMEGLKEYGRGFKKGAKQTIADYWTPNADPDAELKLKDLAKEIDVFADANVSNRSGVDENNFKETMKNNRTVFKNKALKLYDKCIKFGLAFGDNPFYKGAYDQTVLELNTLREQGKLKLPEDITDEQFETWVKAIATAQGLEAVYQDNTKLADGAAKIKQGLGEMSEGYIGVDVLSGASMPFVRTPMNVIKTNLELSPLGIVKNAIQTISEIRANLENGRSALDSTSFRQARFVRETSRNLVGLIMFAAGLALKDAGLLTGGYSDDDREKQAQKESGMQEYALVNPFNGNQYSINWIPGLGSSLVSASAFEDAYSKPDQDGIDALANGIKAGSASMFEMAALQGLQRLTGSANYNSDNSLIDNVAQTVANTASSAIVPAFVRQAAAALDPYKRNTYGTGGKESVFNNAIAGIPFLREQMLQPRIGMNGQPMEQNAGRNGFEKWFDNLVNPAMVTVPSALTDPVRDEATRLYEATGSSSAYQPKIGINSLKTEDHTPTTEEYTEFLQITDSAMNQVASELIQSDYYAGLTDEQRVDTLNSIYTAVQSVEKARYLGTDKEFSGASKAYEDGGTQGLIDYFVAKNTLADMGVQNNPDNREVITEAMNNGTFDEMEQLGFDFNSVKKYEHATNYIPSLTPAQFQNTWNAINTDGNTSIKIDEVIDYLNRDPGAYTSETALQYWNAFYTGTSEKIPVLVNGEWQAEKASQQSSSTADDIGQYGAGNIDLYNRPQYIQPDGSVSTVNSMSINDGGMEVLIPTIAYDNYGRPYQMTDQEAINHYYQTGEYLGKFKTVQEADAYAEKLHQQQEKLYA